LNSLRSVHLGTMIIGVSIYSLRSAIVLLDDYREK